jgi:hypothetical protein
MLNCKAFLINCVKFWAFPQHLVYIYRHFGTLCQVHLQRLEHFKPLKKDLTEGSETSANINQTPGKQAKVDTVNNKHGKSLKPTRLFFLQAMTGSISGDVHDFRNIKTRVLITFFPARQGKALKVIHAILIEILGKHAPLYANIKNWVA